MDYLRRLFAVAFLFFNFNFSTLARSYDQQNTWFNNSDCEVVNGGLTGRYMYDLKDYTYGNQDNSIIALHGFGIWIFYDYPGYGGESELVLLRGWGQCIRLTTLVARASSVRHVGHNSDHSLPSITLYDGANFTGREIFISDDQPKALFGVPSPFGSDLDGFSENIGSLIITGGPTSCWTLYYSVGYYRDEITKCVCGLDSPNFIPNAIPNNPFPPQNRVGSVKKGCVTGRRNGQPNGPSSPNKVMYNEDGILLLG